MFLSTLRSYLQAMGPDLQIKAVFKDQEVVINLFEDIEERDHHRARRVKVPA